MENFEIPAAQSTVWFHQNGNIRVDHFGSRTFKKTTASPAHEPDKEARAPI
jgi:hypothetical protein